MSEAKDKRGFFTIYKPGQGKWVRWGTVAGATLLASVGALWLGMGEMHIALLEIQWIIAIVTVWMILWALGTFWFVNSPRYGEFLIMTESEMRKVSWPSRREVINSTKVVIMLTVCLGVILWLVDLGFVKLFQFIGIS